MANTTTVTTSYTSDIVVNGTTISADKIYVNGTQVRRCIVNGKDVIHKFTRTVVTASSNLTLIFAVYFTVNISTSSGYTNYRFTSPISVDVKVSDTTNGSSGFTSITLVTPILNFFCDSGEYFDGSKKLYQQQLTNQSLPIGKTTTLTYAYFDNKYIARLDHTSFTQYTGYQLNFQIQAPDGTVSEVHTLEGQYNEEKSYQDTNMLQHEVDNVIISDSTVQEY